MSSKLLKNPTLLTISQELAPKSHMESSGMSKLWEVPICPNPKTSSIPIMIDKVNRANKPLRRYFMLLEVLIALGLTMLLLSILMTFYMQISQVSAELEKEQEKSFKKLYLSTRLAAIVPKAIAPTNKDKDFFFFSASANDGLTKGGTQTLVFTFDNGVKLDTAFANHVIGRLYINQENQFCLALWPSPKRLTDTAYPPMKHEVLFENVEDLAFEFFVPPTRNRKLVFSKSKSKFKETEFLKTETLGEWKKEWQQEYNELPSLIKIILTLKGKKEPEKIILAYPLPLSRFVIVYDE